MAQTESTVERKPLVGFQSYEATDSTPDSELAYLPTLPELRCECLVKGTLVQTATGLKPVDEIHAGELVLSQEIQSGELSLKPVCAPTRRPAGDVMTIAFAESDAGVVQATPGHGWFVSGSGWVRTKNLKTGMRIHTATGNVEVESVSLNEKAEITYNLIVADNHTYFVGKDRMLSYDNTPISPTSRPVPGYGELRFVAK